MPTFYDPLQRFIDAMHLPPSILMLFATSRFEHGIPLGAHYHAMRDQGYFLKDIVVDNAGAMRWSWGGPDEVTEHGRILFITIDH